jgi:hypothetical protein
MLRCVDPMVVDIDIEVHGNLKSALRRRIKKLHGFLVEVGLRPQNAI